MTNSMQTWTTWPKVQKQHLAKRILKDLGEVAIPSLSFEDRIALVLAIRQTCATLDFFLYKTDCMQPDLPAIAEILEIFVHCLDATDEIVRSLCQEDEPLWATAEESVCFVVWQALHCQSSIEAWFSQAGISPPSHGSMRSSLITLRKKAIDMTSFLMEVWQRPPADSADVLMKLAVTAASEPELLPILPSLWKLVHISVPNLSAKSCASSIKLYRLLFQTICEAFTQHLQSLQSSKTSVVQTCKFSSFYLSQLHNILKRPEISGFFCETTKQAYKYQGDILARIHGMLHHCSLILSQGIRDSVSISDQLQHVLIQCQNLMVLVGNEVPEVKLVAYMSSDSLLNMEDIHKSSGFTKGDSAFANLFRLTVMLCQLEWENLHRTLDSGCTKVNLVKLTMEYLGCAPAVQILSSSARRQSLFAILTVAACTFVHCFSPEELLELELVLFQNLLSTQSTLVYFLTQDVLQYLASAGPSQLRSRWINSIPILVACSGENLEVLERLTSLLNTLRGSPFPISPISNNPVRGIPGNDQMVSLVLRLWATNEDIVAQNYEQGFPVTAPWDYMCRQLDDENEADRPTRCFEVLSTPVGVLTKLAQSCNSKLITCQSLEELRLQLNAQVRLLPVLIEGSQSAMEMVQGSRQRGWRIMQTVAALVYMAATACSWEVLADLSDTLNSLRDHPYFDVIPKHAVYDLLMALSAWADASVQNISLYLLGSDLDSSSWIAVQQAVNCLAEFTANSSADITTMNPDQRNLTLNYIQRRPYISGDAGKSQVPTDTVIINICASRHSNPLQINKPQGESPIPYRHLVDGNHIFDVLHFLPAEVTSTKLSKKLISDFLTLVGREDFTIALHGPTEQQMLSLIAARLSTILPRS
ncbi:hypothetical protein DFS34DRAFT_637043 [Phlyctochytrium arcticum]|nr:hypothetical protein DFS34DRAFT_637043 [Phlyctochytrium arcticum]